ncbi:MAG TPA: acyl-CoA synthetase [Thermoleophilaceae bacterium]|jgi:fatty-acyl-CoA synthase
MSVAEIPVRLGMRAAVELHSLGSAVRAGMLGVESPQRTFQAIQALRRYGVLGGELSIAALRHGERTALVDELGELSFADLDRRSNALANALRSRGIGEGTSVAIYCRNHRGFLDATYACAKSGARALYLNTDFAGPQVRDVCERENVEALIHDEEFTGMVEGVAAPRGRFLAWTDSEPDVPTLEELIESGDPSPPPAPDGQSSVVMLTSGTTGTPKGAPRTQPRSLAAVGALLSKVPFRSEEATYVAAPLFHALGFAHAAVAMGLGSTLVIKRRFEPQQTLAAVAERRTTALIVVPVMLQRILALGDDELARHDTSALRIIFVSGSQLEGDLARRAMDRFGDVVYNLYGSTEVAWATIGTPEDLRAAPGCAGRPPFGTRVRLYDADGRPAARGETGRIFVGNVLPFEGYTGGGTKEIIDGLMSTGDVGHFDEAGRLFVDGRDDEMIVSGGENVFPREIEELLATHEDVEEAAALGVPDEQYGQRLRVFLVPRRELSEDDVKSFIRENLARFKVPREVVFVDELPRNPAGKILKRQLAEQQP